MSPLRKGPAVLLVGVLCLSIAVSGAQTATPAPQPAAPAVSQKLVPGRFIDVTDKVGVKFQHQALHTSRKYLLETMRYSIATTTDASTSSWSTELPTPIPLPPATSRKRPVPRTGIACTIRNPMEPSRTSPRSPDSRASVTTWAWLSPTTTTTATRTSS